MLLRVVPVIGNALDAVLSTLIPALSQQIGSSNSNVRQAAVAVFDALIQHVDSTSLVQHFAQVIAFGAPRAKAITDATDTASMGAPNAEIRRSCAKHNACYEGRGQEEGAGPIAVGANGGGADEARSYKITKNPLWDVSKT